MYNAFHTNKETMIADAGTAASVRIAVGRLASHRSLAARSAR